MITKIFPASGRLLLAIGLISLFFIPAATQAQWLDKYPNPSGLYSPTGIQQTIDSGYVMAGFVYTGTADFRNPVGWLTKLNSNGTIEWQKNYVGTGGPTLLGMNAIEQTSDSGYVMAVNRGDSSGNPNIASVLKLNFDGSVAWWHHYADPPSGGQGSGIFLRPLSSIQQTAEGGYIAAGPANFSGNSSFGLAVLKLTSSGASQWTRLCGFNAGSAMNALIRQTTEGGYVVAGWKPIPNPNNGGQDIYAAKLDTNGNFIWRKFYTANPGGYIAGAGGEVCTAALNSFEQTSDGGYFMAGRTSCGHFINLGPILALKLKPDGAIDWQMAYGVTGMSLDALSAVQTSDGGFLVAGSARTTNNGATPGAFLLRLNADGSIAWQRIYAGDSGSSDIIESIKQTLGGGYIAAVQSSGTNSTMMPKVLNLDASGNIDSCGSATSVGPLPSNLSIIVPDDTNILFGNYAQATVTETQTAIASDAAFTSEILCGVRPAQLQVTKTADSGSTTVGQNLSYTITIKNKGPDTAQAVTLTDPLSGNVTFQSASSTQGTCAQSSGVVTCNVGSLANAGVVTVTIVVTPNAAVDIANTATVSAANSQSAQGSVTTLGAPANTTLGNISTRLSVQTGDNALIGGFIVTGTQPKKVVVRGIGPSLPLSGALADPVLELHDGSGGLLESNDNWVDSPNKQAIIDSKLAPSNNLESAIVRTLPANNAGYTAILRGKDNGTGIGVVEAFDLDSTTDSKLANISTRGLVGTGNNVLIAGTIITGHSPQKVIIRAIGPSLSVSGNLADPILELHDGNGAVVEANDNWVDSPNKQAIIGSTVPPTNDKESAIVRILPGNNAGFTAIVRGVNNTTGIAVVEVYALN